jgi:ATP-binding cassette subfamily B protein
MAAQLRRFRRIGSLLRPYRLRVAAAVIAITVTTIATLAPPYLAGRAVDDVINAGTTEILDEIVAAMAVAVIIAWVAGWTQNYLVGWVGQMALRDLRLRLFEHLQELSVGFYDRHSAGQLISRMTNNVEALDQLVTDGVNSLVSSIVTLIGAFIVLFVLDAELALVAVGALPLLGIGSWLYAKASASAYRESMNTVSDVTDYMEESLSGARVVRTFVQEQRHIDAFDGVNERNRDMNWRAFSYVTLYLPFVASIGVFATSAVLLVGGFQVIDGGQQLGIIVSFIGYLGLALAPLPNVASLYSLYQQGAAALDQSFELLDEPAMVADPPDAAELSPVRGEISFDDVTFRYSEDRPVLEGVSLTVAPGETVAIVGPTGAGKSTLIKLVPRFYDPDSGSVRVDGRDIREVTKASLRRQIGLVPQEPLLFSGTISENIAFADPSASADEIERAARSVGVLDVLEALPNGLETQVGERGSSLSAGQVQLVALARAALPDPRIVILDEATASIDVGTETRIRQALTRLLDGRTALIVAHRLSTVRDADRIVVVDGGTIAEVGTHDELVAAGGVYARMFAQWSAPQED